MGIVATAVVVIICVAVAMTMTVVRTVIVFTIANIAAAGATIVPARINVDDRRTGHEHRRARDDDRRAVMAMSVADGNIEGESRLGLLRRESREHCEETRNEELFHTTALSFLCSVVVRC
jgi:hypothetical protein